MRLGWFLLLLGVGCDPATTPFDENDRPPDERLEGAGGGAGDGAPLVCEKFDAEGGLTDRWTFDDALRVVELERYGPFDTFGPGEPLPRTDTPRIVETFRYDDAGRVIEERKTTEQSTRVITHTWDGDRPVEQVSRSTLDDGEVSIRTTRYEHDADGRLTTERRFDGADVLLSEEITRYDMEGRRASRTTDTATTDPETGESLPADGVVDWTVRWTYPEPGVELSQQFAPDDQLLANTLTRRDAQDRRIERQHDFDLDAFFEQRQSWRFEGDLLVEITARLLDPATDEVVETIEVIFTRQADRMTRTRDGAQVAQTICSAPIDFDLTALP